MMAEGESEDRARWGDLPEGVMKKWEAWWVTASPRAAAATQLPLNQIAIGSSSSEAESDGSGPRRQQVGVGDAHTTALTISEDDTTQHTTDCPLWGSRK